MPKKLMSGEGIWKHELQSVSTWAWHSDFVPSGETLLSKDPGNDNPSLTSISNCQMIFERLSFMVD